MDAINDPIEITGKNLGPVSVILAGVHGDELGGIKAFEEILPNLKIDNGKVYFIYGNPEAIKKSVRYIQSNLNRMFKNESEINEIDKISYEYNRAQFIKKYLDKSNALLDIHSSFTPESKPFIIAENNSIEITKFLPFDLVVSGFDNVEPGGTDYYMNKKGGTGICIECGYLTDDSSQKIAKESIHSFLKLRGHINNDGRMNQLKQSNVNITDIYYTKTNNFTLQKHFCDFEKVSKGQLIATDGDEKIFAEKDGVILFARNLNEVNDEGFLFGENIKTLV